MSRASTPLDMTPLTRHLGFLLRLAQQQVFDEFHRSIGPAGITPARYAVLALLHANPGITQARLAEALRVKTSNMTVLLAGMEAQGLVERRVDSNNRRANLLCLAPAGKAQREALAPVVLALEQQVAQRLSPPEQATLLALLTRLTQP